MNNSTQWRSVLRKLSLNESDYPYIQLHPSKLGGVGLFAIRDIPKGTVIYRSNPGNELYLSKEEMDKLPPQIKRFYENYGVVIDGGKTIIVPKDPNHISAIWYINHGKGMDTNVGTTPDAAEYTTLRDISEGEELLVDYNTFDVGENIF